MHTVGGVRLHRFLWLCCVSLLVLGLGGLGAFGGTAQALLLTGPPPGSAAVEESEAQVASTVPPTTATLPSPPARPSTSATAASTSSVGASSPTDATVPPMGARPDPPSSRLPLVMAPTTGVAAPEPAGLIPCAVRVEPLSSRLNTGSASAGTTGSSPLAVRNCRPVVGDVVAVHTVAFSPFGATQVAFGDGTFAGKATASCPITSNSVEAEHRYARAGRYLLEATWRFPCTPEPPIVHRVWIEVSDGQVPEAPGAAPCHGLGPAKAGEPARQGIGTRMADSRFDAVEIRLLRCSVPLGQQSEVYLWWYEAAAVVDWGDGTSPQAIGAPGQQGASSVHTHATRGLHVVTVRPFDHDGKAQPPVTFTMQVS